MPTIARWGDSLAVSIPKDVLEHIGLEHGDAVDIIVNEAGHIEIVPVDVKHRHVQPESGITFDSLFADYTGGPQRIRDEKGNPLDPWIDDGFYGAERYGFADSTSGM